MNLCFDMVITKKDVDDVLVKMVALRELHLNNDESWSECQGRGGVGRSSAWCPARRLRRRYATGVLTGCG